MLKTGIVFALFAAVSLVSGLSSLSLNSEDSAYGVTVDGDQTSCVNVPGGTLVLGHQDGKRHVIEQIKIYATASRGKGPEVTNIRAYVTDTTTQDADMETNQRKYRLCATDAGGSNVPYTLQCANGAVGMYIVLLFDSTSKTEICKIEAFGYHDVNLARGRDGNMKDIPELSIHYAMDGRVNPDMNINTCARSQELVNPWINVKLNLVSNIEMVSVINRPDCCFGDLTGLQVFVKNESSDSAADAPGFFSTDMCASLTGTSEAGTLNFVCLATGNTVFLRISHENPIKLTVCELMVYASPAASDPFCSTTGGRDLAFQMYLTPQIDYGQPEIVVSSNSADLQGFYPPWGFTDGLGDDVGMVTYNNDVTAGYLEFKDTFTITTVRLHTGAYAMTGLKIAAVTGEVCVENVNTVANSVNTFTCTSPVTTNTLVISHVAGPDAFVFTPEVKVAFGYFTDVEVCGS